MKKKATIFGRELVDKIVSLAHDRKAEDISILDLRSRATVADWFVVCGADNTSHCRAIYDAIVDGLSAQGVSPWRMEGVEDGRWILIDFVDVIVHVMLREIREYYDLEHLWQEQPVKEAPRTRTVRKKKTTTGS